MITREYGDYLQDILDSINDIKEFIGDLTFDEFVRDQKTAENGSEYQQGANQQTRESGKNEILTS